LMYIKEDLIVRRIADKVCVGSRSINNSADGHVDIWDGEDVSILLDPEAPPSSLPGKYELMIRRQTVLFPPEELNSAVCLGDDAAIVAMLAWKEANDKKEEWLATLQALRPNDSPDIIAQPKPLSTGFNVATTQSGAVCSMGKRPMTPGTFPAFQGGATAHRVSGPRLGAQPVMTSGSFQRCVRALPVTNQGGHHRMAAPGSTVMGQPKTVTSPVAERPQPRLLTLQQMPIFQGGATALRPDRNGQVIL